MASLGMALSAAGLSNDRGDRGRHQRAFNLALSLRRCRLLGGGHEAAARADSFEELEPRWPLERVRNRRAAGYRS
jgi:hypothetical protein